MDEQPEGRRARIPPAVIWGIVLFIVGCLALYIRVHFAHDEVFSGGIVWFKEQADAYYHMRLVENLLQHFPYRINFDPYSFYPHGCPLGWTPFYDWLIAFSALIAGGGHPSPHTVETVGAYIPAILGALTVVPVYFIGKELFSRWAGIFAAVLVAILPGEFMNRSLLGFTDHHVAEVLFSTTTIMFLIMAVRRFKEREVSFSHLINRDWAVIKKPLIYALLAAIFLGIYLLTWFGGLMLVFIIFVYLVIQFVIDHLRGISTDYLAIIGVVLFAVAAVMSLHFIPRHDMKVVSAVSLAVAIVVPIALSAISRFMTGRGWKPAYYPLVLLGIAGIGLLLFWAIDPTLLHAMVGKFKVFNPRAAGLTVAEVQPLDMMMAWTNFNIAFFISLISLAWLIYRAAKEKSADKTLFLVWCAVMVAAVFGQRRFCYYFTINIALLTGYFCWRVIDAAGLKTLLTKTRPKEVVKAYTTRRKKKKAKAMAEAKGKGWLQPRSTWIRVIVTGIVIFFLVFFPNIDPNDVATRILYPRLYVDNLPALGRTQASADIGRGRFGTDWYGALTWLRNNTPEPFDDPDYYYELYQPPPQGEDFDYPQTAYGVMSWWDYGHVITRIGRRIPCANPFQKGPVEAGIFLTSQNETSADRMMNQLGAKYVIIDNLMAFSFTYPFVAWAQENETYPYKISDFYEICYAPVGGGEMQPVRVFYPGYYNSIVVRLYTFNGQAVVPAANDTVVISYRESLDQRGNPYKELTTWKPCASYEEAVEFVSAHPAGNYRIAGVDPTKSPVPLEKVEHYQLIYTAPGNSVKIFEYTG